MNEFRRVKVRRPTHPDLKRQWPKWLGETLVRQADRRVFIADVMHPSHMMTRLPPTGSPESVEHDAYVFIDIDWGIANASNAKERENYLWFKKFILDRFDGKPTDLPAPVYPKVCGKGRSMTLKLEDGRHYDVPTDPGEFLKTLEHLSRKTWATPEFMTLAVNRVAKARGWDPGAFALALFF